MSRFTFGEVEAILAELNDVASHKRVAFSSRLKNLQKQGLSAEEAAPGRGRVAKFDYCDLINLAAGVELIRLGLPPQRAASIVSKSSSAFRYTSYLATYTDDEARDAAEENGLDLPELHHAWLVRFDAMADLTNDGFHEADDFEAVEDVPLSEVRAIFEIALDGNAVDHPFAARRHLVIHGTALCRRVVEIVAYSFRLATPSEMRADVLAAFKRLEQILATVDLGMKKEPGGGNGGS